MTSNVGVGAFSVRSSRRPRRSRRRNPLPESDALAARSTRFALTSRLLASGPASPTASQVRIPPHAYRFDDHGGDDLLTKGVTISQRIAFIVVSSELLSRRAVRRFCGRFPWLWPDCPVHTECVAGSIDVVRPSLYRTS